MSMELRPFGDSDYDLLRALEEQEDVWENVGPLLLPQPGNHLFAIVESGTAIGVGGLVRSPVLQGKDYELVCALFSEAQLRGLALKACQLLLEWAFTSAKIERVISSIDNQNEGARSIAVKLGMRELPSNIPGRTLYAKDRFPRSASRR
ncbi:MAG TPA: GNAT family N-acetyltransferase [Gemmatimonadales bacterium]|nr:GNAT family N-acetyltransferase [Gemmatimonadales bacterium]